MRKAHINSVKPGELLAKTILLENGSVLLGTGVQLSERYIQRLRTMGIDYVYIDDPHTGDIIPDDVIRDDTRKKALESIHKTMAGLIDHPMSGGKSPGMTENLGSSFRKVFSEIMFDLTSRKDVLVNLTNLHAMDGYLFHHSVNVAVLAGIVGMARGYNQTQLSELGVGALLFDIGMTQIPKDLMFKQGVLTAQEQEQVRRHTELGFNLLRRQHDISLLSAHCALQHHERYDGTGYPRRLAGTQIHEYAQIVAIADVYDALTSPRSYRNRFMPNEAIEFLFAAGNSYFEVGLIRLFCKHISIYPIASTVQLSSGQVGVVSSINPVAVHRPTVRIIQEADGRRIPSPYEVDLHKEYTLTIVKTL